MRWPQHLTYQIRTESDIREVSVLLDRKATSCREEIDRLPAEGAVILPNTDGRGYGFFQISEEEADGLWEAVRTSDDEALRGSLLITLYENLRRKTISPMGFREAMLRYLPEETNDLLFTMALGYFG